MTTAGARAEALAAEYLMRHGLAIVERNFRTRFGEIDLIARDGRVLVFVEVRLRRSAAYGGAIESITARKRARLVAAANGYLAMIGREPACRFDAILMHALDAHTIEWRRDIVGVDA
ncbi:MAG: YraN family protein [Casimicrobiaceae bacterium]|nr:YraN family protein [Pseudomonadota bacterium]